MPVRNRRAAAAAGEPPADETHKRVAEYRQRFLDAMDDDFNTGAAMGDLFELVRALNRLVDERRLEEPGHKDAASLATLDEGVAVLRELSALVNLFQQPVTSPAAAGANDELIAGLMGLVIELRAEARATKNFAVADKIRQKLAELKITLADRPGGTDWTIG